MKVQKLEVRDECTGRTSVHSRETLEKAGAGARKLRGVVGAKAWHDEASAASKDRERQQRIAGDVYAPVQDTHMHTHGTQSGKSNDQWYALISSALVGGVL